jgi:hypothetical protein
MPLYSNYLSVLISCISFHLYSLSNQHSYPSSPVSVASFLVGLIPRYIKLYGGFRQPRFLNTQHVQCVHIQDSFDLEKADSLAVEAPHSQSVSLPAYISFPFCPPNACRSICALLPFSQAILMLALLYYLTTTL